MWHSGWPYTPTCLRVDTLENTETRFSLRSTHEVGRAELGAPARLQANRRAVDSVLRHAPRAHLSVFGEVYNLFGNTNARGMWKQLRVRGRGVLVETGEITQWPRLPLAGLSWEF